MADEQEITPEQVVKEAAGTIRDTARLLIQFQHALLDLCEKMEPLTLGLLSVAALLDPEPAPEAEQSEPAPEHKPATVH